MSAAPGRVTAFPQPHHREDRILRCIAASAAMSPDPTAFGPLPAEDLQLPDLGEEHAPIRGLLVNAHPDDESESAAMVYRLTHELGATVDQVVVTNGEGGHQYAALAEAYYRLPLTSATDRREILAQVRREELMRASRILGIRHNYFLDQTDTGVTLNAADGFEAWDIERIKHEVRVLLEFERYDVVVVLLPSSDTHGHHKTVAAITLELVGELDKEDRPAAVGVRTMTAGSGDPEAFPNLTGYPVTQTVSSRPVWSFDRRTPLLCHPSLDYSVVVNWVISEHKSQGFFQMEGGRRTHEYFWLFEAGGAAGTARWRDVVQKLGESSLPVRRETAA